MNLSMPLQYVATNTLTYLPILWECHARHHEGVIACPLLGRVVAGGGLEG